MQSIYFFKIMQTDILKTFGNQVRQFRLERKLSQEDLAELSKLHRTYIGMVERGERNITLKNIQKLANALDVEIVDLVNFE